MIEMILLLLIGLGAGFLGGLLGIGGGLLTVPCFLFVFRVLQLPGDYAMQTAVGTSLGVMVFTGIASVWAHALQKGMFGSFLQHFLPGVVAGSVAGALIDDYLPSRTIQMLFSVYVLSIGIRFLIPSTAIPENVSKVLLPKLKNIWLMGLLTGTVSSALGVGGATMTIPFLTHHHVSMHRAIATSACVTLVIAVTGTVSFMYFGWGRENMEGSFGYLYLPALFASGIASMIAAPFGAWSAYRLPVSILRYAFGVFLILVGIALW